MRAARPPGSVLAAPAALLALCTVCNACQVALSLILAQVVAVCCRLYCFVDSLCWVPACEVVLTLIPGTGQSRVLLPALQQKLFCGHEGCV